MTPQTRDTRVVIPAAAWVTAGVVSLGMLMLFSILMTRGAAPFPFWFFMIIPALLVGAYVVLVGYVYEDAKRRGMRYVMWTWLAILVPNGIGIILYFLLRDPIPVYCSRCGLPAQPGFVFCPRCGTGMAPACPQCHKMCQVGWTHCPYCGSTL